MNPIINKIHEELGIQEKHLTDCRLSICEQAPLDQLVVVDIHFDGRPFILEKNAGAMWAKMRRSASVSGISLEPYSGFRSYLHQKKLIAKKLADGKPLEVILTETAIPGFSEHHSGRAVDICTADKYQLEEEFEKTTAFEWLTRHANEFKFRLSYPRDNSLGIIYEPWHWYFTG